MFTTLALKKLSCEYDEHASQYTKLQSSVAKEIITITGSYFLPLERINELVALIDVILAFAYISKIAPTEYTRPVLVEEGDMILHGARHPMVEVQDDVCFIENDAEFRQGKLKSTSRLDISYNHWT